MTAVCSRCGRMLLRAVVPGHNWHCMFCREYVDDATTTTKQSINVAQIELERRSVALQEEVWRLTNVVTAQKEALRSWRSEADRDAGVIARLTKRVEQLEALSC